MRTIQELTPKDFETILHDAPIKCYHDIAEDMDIPINTVKRVIRTQNEKKLKRYKWVNTWG
ncbi:hypothetical protein [uncultured Methanolobus sp.]|uniref:hypothetical protein n=1 Tax=uncultured Methanolobus sp. TaxID=218300 RepID=UPI0029C7549F|nr:hypothetical protein [uncultured Methanolobus sp.]